MSVPLEEDSEYFETVAIAGERFLENLTNIAMQRPSIKIPGAFP
jgi:hypothetical protein